MLRCGSIFPKLLALRAKAQRKSPKVSEMFALKLANLTKIILKTLRSVRLWLDGNYLYWKPYQEKRWWYSYALPKVRNGGILVEIHRYSCSCCWWLWVRIHVEWLDVRLGKLVNTILRLFSGQYHILLQIQSAKKEMHFVVIFA